MFGGRRESGGSGQLLSDVWEWDGARWREIRDAGLEPVLHAAAGFDPVRKRVVIYGGVTNAGMSHALREWDGRTWMTRNTTGPPTLTAAALSTTPRGDVIVIGLTPTADSDPVPPPAPRTHVWTGNAWKPEELGPAMANLQPTGSAPDRVKVGLPAVGHAPSFTRRKM